MPDILNVGLVGCGRIAERHAEVLGRHRVRGLQLTAVCDVATDRARALGDCYGVSHYSDMNAMMQSECIDLIAVLTPSGDHAKHVCYLSRFRRHIVVEKPMALTPEDADAMVRACEESGVKLFVVKQNRWNQPIRRLRAAIEEQRFGRLVLGTARLRWCREQSYYSQEAWRGTWARDGGVLANQASHFVDLLQWMMGPVARVAGMAATTLVDIETEDTLVAILTFRSGALGVIEATTATRPADLEGSISILGEHGAVVIGGTAANRVDSWTFADAKREPAEPAEVSLTQAGIYSVGHREYYEHIVDCLTNEQSALVDGKEGRKTVAIVDAIYRSIRSGLPVAMD